MEPLKYDGQEYSTKYITESCFLIINHTCHIVMMHFEEIEVNSQHAANCLHTMAHGIGDHIGFNIAQIQEQTGTNTFGTICKLLNLN